MVYSKRRGILKGVQFISYARLAKDIEQWSKSLQGKYSKIIGIPRSGLTVAHMLSVHLNCPIMCHNLCSFRQASGRPLSEINKHKILVVDDCCSYGNAINEFKQTYNIDADYGVVYTRPIGANLAGLNTFYSMHAEPDWLVITEWNWMHHQDINYIAITDDVTVPNRDAVDHVYSKLDESTIYDYNNSEAALLVTRSLEIEYYKEMFTKPVLDLNTMQVYGQKERIFNAVV